MKESLNVMNLTCTFHERIGNVENENNSPVNIKFVSKASDVRNLSENIRSDGKASEVATLTPLLK